MIDSKELRIGNWVYASSSILIHHNRPEMVHEIVEGGVNNMAPFYYNPIPLTPEILEKCGFDRYGDGNDRWEIGNLMITMLEDDSYTAIWDCYALPLCTLHYIHQLQNLYFALTGQELEVTP